MEMEKGNRVTPTDFIQTLKDGRKKNMPVIF